MKTDDSSWKRIGIKWKQNDDNIALSLKLIELMIYEYEANKSTRDGRSYHRSILQPKENLQRNIMMYISMTFDDNDMIPIRQ